MAGTRSDLRQWAARLAASVGSVLLLYWAAGWFESFSDHLSATFNWELWRWFVGAALLVLAGTIVGVAMGNRVPRGRFDWKAPVALGIVPLFLAMTLPMFFWGWPGSRTGSWLWSFRTEFVSSHLDRPAWVLVGFAIAAGWGRR